MTAEAHVVHEESAPPPPPGSWPMALIFMSSLLFCTFVVAFVACLSLNGVLSQSSLFGASHRTVVLIEIGACLSLAVLGCLTFLFLRPGTPTTIDRLFAEHSRLLESISREESDIASVQQPGKQPPQQLETSLAAHRNLLSVIDGQIRQLESTLKPSDPILDRLVK